MVPSAGSKHRPPSPDAPHFSPQFRPGVVQLGCPRLRPVRWPVSMCGCAPKEVHSVLAALRLAAGGGGPGPLRVHASCVQSGGCSRSRRPPGCGSLENWDLLPAERSRQRGWPSCPGREAGEPRPAFLLRFSSLGPFLIVFKREPDVSVSNPALPELAACVWTEVPSCTRGTGPHGNTQLCGVSVGPMDA